MRTSAEIVKELEEAKKRIASLESQNFALESAVAFMRDDLEAQKKSLRVTELKQAQDALRDAQNQLSDLKDWLDKNYRFMEVKEGAVRIETHCKRVWYFASDRTDLYPMSNVAGAAA